MKNVNSVKSVIALTALTSTLFSGPASAWEQRHNHRHGNGDAAVALIGGLVLGAALADTASRSRSYSSSTTYYSDYPTQYSSRTTYYPAPYYSRPYDSERIYVSGPVRTTYYSAPVRSYYSPPAYRYPARKRVQHVYYDDTLRDEYGNCYAVNYVQGRKILKEIPRNNCTRG